MTAYYNENDPYAAQWLRNLIAAGHIAPGEVDERSILDVRADDLRGFTQCHFFAGIGVWSHALRLAGWADSRPVWTGSAPCQPFSQAGAGQADEDDRHLAPVWLRLIAERRPAVVFGEQVDAAVRVGWLDALFTELEAHHYACGAFSFNAASVGAPHIRQRLYFVADSQRGPAERHGLELAESARGVEGEAQERQRLRDDARHGLDAGELADPDGRNASEEGLQRSGEHRQQQEDGGVADGIGDAAGRGFGMRGRASWEGGRTPQPGPTNGFWRLADWLPCIDGKARPVESGTFPLAHVDPQRVGRLRAYGNAICAEQAAEFVRAYLA